jgi:hypothetical protein
METHMSRLSNRLDKLLLVERQQMTCYVGRERTEGPFVPGFVSDNIMQALTYAAWSGDNPAVYKITLPLEPTTHLVSQVDQLGYGTPELYAAMEKLPQPGVFDHRRGEGIVNVEVDAPPMTASEVAITIAGGDGVGGSHQGDIDRQAIMRALPRMFPDDHCVTVKALCDEDPGSFEDSVEMQDEIYMILDACGAFE